MFSDRICGKFSSNPRTAKSRHGEGLRMAFCISNFARCTRVLSCFTTVFYNVGFTNTRSPSGEVTRLGYGDAALAADSPIASSSRDEPATEPGRVAHQGLARWQCCMRRWRRGGVRGET